jgi:hypothetical protein
MDNNHLMYEVDPKLTGVEKLEALCKLVRKRNLGLHLDDDDIKRAAVKISYETGKSLAVYPQQLVVLAKLYRGSADDKVEFGIKLPAGRKPFEYDFNYFGETVNILLVLTLGKHHRTFNRDD